MPSNLSGETATKQPVRPLRTCLHCGGQFKGYGNRPMKYCGRACSAAVRTTGKNHIQSECAACGKTILAYTKRKFCNKECETTGKRSQIPVDREWLKEKYVTEGIDANAIAEIVNRDGKTVWSWLKMHGIPTRSRGGNTATHFKKGQIPANAGKPMPEEQRKRLSEIAKADGRVPFDPAVGSYMKGRKGSQVPNWKGGVTPERQALYSSDEWKAVIGPVWGRDNATCQRCGLRRTRGVRLQFAIHHIVSFAYVPLRADLENLTLLCRPCHLWVHSNNNVDKLFIKEIPDVIA